MIKKCKPIQQLLDTHVWEPLQRYLEPNVGTFADLYVIGKQGKHGFHYDKVENVPSFNCVLPGRKVVLTGPFLYLREERHLYSNDAVSKYVCCLVEFPIRFCT